MPLYAEDIIRLPSDLWTALSSYHPSEIDFFWVVTDVEEILARHGHDLNLVHHAWLFPEATPTKRCMDSFDMGMFSVFN